MVSTIKLTRTPIAMPLLGVVLSFNVTNRYARAGSFFHVSDTLLQQHSLSVGSVISAHKNSALFSIFLSIILCVAKAKWSSASVILSRLLVETISICLIVVSHIVDKFIAILLSILLVILTNFSFVDLAPLTISFMFFVKMMLIVIALALNHLSFIAKIVPFAAFVGAWFAPRVKAICSLFMAVEVFRCRGVFNATPNA